MDFAWLSSVSVADVALLLFALFSLLSSNKSTRNVCDVLNSFSTNLHKRDLKDIANDDIDNLIKYHSDAIVRLENLKKEKE